MYSYKQESHTNSLKFIGWSTLGITVFYIIFSVGRLIAGDLPEMTATEVFFLIGLSIFLAVVFFKTQKISHHNYEKIGPYSSFLDEPIDRILKVRKTKIKLFKYKDGKLIQIGFLKTNIPGTVNTCPKEWIKEVIKNIDGFRDYPDTENIKN